MSWLGASTPSATAVMPSEWIREMIAWKSEGTRIYQSLPAKLRDTLKPTAPLREVEPGRPVQTKDYITWKESST